jgi:hypothetical protein
MTTAMQNLSSASFLIWGTTATLPKNAERMDVCFRRVLCVAGTGQFDGPIPRPLKSPTDCSVSLCVCDLETSRIRRPWPAVGCCLNLSSQALNSWLRKFLYFAMWCCLGLQITFVSNIGAYQQITTASHSTKRKSAVPLQFASMHPMTSWRVVLALLRAFNCF